MDPQLAESLVGPGFRTFVRITHAWGLSPDEQRALLGSPSGSTFDERDNDPPAQLSLHLLERFGCVIAIYKNLHTLLNQPLADEWLRRSNTHALFGGRPPLERMLSGQLADLYVVRRYLDAELGG
jgi:hypothetical protein